MRQHTIVGERIVGAAPVLRGVAAAVRSTHERWDGGGYPDGLAGTAIPIEARVVAAVDAWSAMTSDRVYRAALDPATAALELRRVAGAHLGPGRGRGAARRARRAERRRVAHRVRAPIRARSTR